MVLIMLFSSFSSYLLCFQSPIKNACWISPLEKKPYVSLIYDYSFAQNIALKKHKESVDEQDKQHKCSICEQTYSRKDNLEQHVTRFHEK